MRVSLLKDEAYIEDHLKIEYRQMTHEIEKVLEVAHMSQLSVEGYINCERHVLNVTDLYYFDSVDKKTFAYSENEVYEMTASLTDLEASLLAYGFVRISKSVVVNLYKIKCVKAQANMRVNAYLLNDEMLVINRHYKPYFQTQLNQLLKSK